MLSLNSALKVSIGGRAGAWEPFRGRAGLRRPRGGHSNLIQKAAETSYWRSLPRPKTFLKAAGDKFSVCACIWTIFGGLGRV
jgi:hypothetical protein